MFLHLVLFRVPVAQMVEMANPACQAPQALPDPLDLEE